MENTLEDQIADVCGRLLDSEEHSCESAIPPVAEDAAILIRKLKFEIDQLNRKGGN